jgi:hypothetical protein
LDSYGFWWILLDSGGLSSNDWLIVKTSYRLQKHTGPSLAKKRIGQIGKSSFSQTTIFS